MTIDDPAALDFLRRCMVARIATFSQHGRPSITPLYFVAPHGRIWLGTSEWTLTARSVLADPRVSFLFEVEQDRSPHRILRISGRASVRTDLQVQRSCTLRVARKHAPFPWRDPPLLRLTVYFLFLAHSPAATYPGRAWLRVPRRKKGAAVCSALAFHRKKVFRRNPG